jgi:F0F1-type ATP synthase assembly protein I
MGAPAGDPTGDRRAGDREHSDDTPELVRRALFGGFGEALQQAFEFAAVPVLFALLGLWLDDRLGTAPLWTVILVVLGLTGVCVRTYYSYKERVEREEEGKPWTRRHRP